MQVAEGQGNTRDLAFFEFARDKNITVVQEMRCHGGANAYNRGGQHMKPRRLLDALIVKIILSACVVVLVALAGAVLAELIINYFIWALSFSLLLTLGLFVIWNIWRKCP